IALLLERGLCLLEIFGTRVRVLQRLQREVHQVFDGTFRQLLAVHQPLAFIHSQFNRANAAMITMVENTINLHCVAPCLPTHHCVGETTMGPYHTNVNPDLRNTIAILPTCPVHHCASPRATSPPHSRAEAHPRFADATPTPPDPTPSPILWDFPSYGSRPYQRQGAPCSRQVLVWLLPPRRVRGILRG